MKKTSERGNGVVEFALSFSVLSFLFFGIVEIGYGAYLYSSLVTRVGDAARYAARLECTQCAGAGTKFDAYKTRLQNFVVYGSDTVPASPVTAVPGLRPEHVRVTPTYVNPNNSSQGIRDITIAINGFDLVGIRTFRLTNRPSVTVRYAGFYSPPDN